MASSEKELAKSNEGLILDERRQRKDMIWRFKRRTFIIIASISVAVIICAAVGGAVGGYYATKSSSQPPTPTSTSNPDENDSHAVDSGTSGMAHLPCRPATVLPSSQATPRNIANPYYSPIGVHAYFDITCRRGVPTGGDANHNAIVNLRTFITYNLTACMDHCSETDGCKGVVYGANLTAMIADGDPGGGIAC
ncbi:hypothetical protein N0V90_003509 [Kalmusia sp. IMI 367209]|nr:hypothetical protein N0V90_003509 [Kalmusia sp. IMI 367209]